MSSLQQNAIFRDCRRPLIMGVVNVTPDSFSDGGLYYSIEQAVAHAYDLIRQGADILDIGGESTRPGSAPVGLDEELNRVIPVLEALADSNIPISVDTSKPEVMRQAIEAGASIINDINALCAPGALGVIAQNSHVMVCLMHMQGNPQSMQTNPQYLDIVADVKNFLRQRLEAAQVAGVSLDRLIIDPGFGFGKTVQHNFSLLKHLDSFTDLGIPVLAGLSRKSMLGAITGNSVDHRINESIAAALLAVIKGARIVRVHDVKASKDALAIYTAMQDYRA